MWEGVWLEKDLSQGPWLLRRQAASGDWWRSEVDGSAEGPHLHWVWEVDVAWRAELFSSLEVA